MDGWADCKDGKQDGGEIGFILPPLPKLITSLSRSRGKCRQASPAPLQPSQSVTGCIDHRQRVLVLRCEVDRCDDWAASGNRSTYQSAQRELTLTLRLLVVIAHDLVLDTFQILEEQSVVAWRGIFRILPWFTHYRSPYLLQFRMQPIHFSARCRSECKMM